MQVCIICNEQRPLSDFYRHPDMSNGHIGKCKDCCKKQSKLRYYEKHDKIMEYEKIRRGDKKRKIKHIIYCSNFRKKFPLKRIAYYMVSNAIRGGHLKKQPCSVCGSNINIEAHHSDYSLPLSIVWLCGKHHKEWHRQNTVANQLPCQSDKINSRPISVRKKAMF